MATPIDADDIVLELPPADGGHDGDDDKSREGATDEEALGAPDDEHESIGLDVSVGFDQDSDVADLIEDLGSDAHRWTLVSEVGSDQVLIDARDLSDTDADENGWTADNDAAGDTVAHRGDELDDGDLPELGSDAGGDGFADDGAASTGSDAADLPPIDAGEGDSDTPDASVLDSSLLGRLDVVGEREGERLEVSTGLFWPFFPEAHRRLAGSVDAALGTDLLPVGPHTWLWGDGQLINLDAPTHAVARSATYLAADPADGSLVVSSDKGLWRIDTEGASQNLGGPSADATMIADATVAFTLHGSEARLWAQSRIGTLFSLASDPVRWSLVDSPRPGRHLATDGRRALAYIHAAPKRPCALVQSQDAGARWLSRTIAVSDATLVERVLVCRDVVVLVCDSMTVPVMVGVGDEDPAVVIDGLRAPVALVHEDNEVVLYGCVVAPAGVLLVRQPLGRTGRQPSIIAAWSPPDANMPVAISAAYRNGTTDLRVLRVTNGVRRVQRFELEIECDGTE